MSTPLVEIDLDQIGRNAETLVWRLAERGIGVTAVTKAVLGDFRVAEVLLAAGVTGLADSRMGNIEAMRRAGVTARFTLLRSPSLSEVERVVRGADVSCNTEVEVIAALGRAAVAQGRVHDVLLMVELGDLREGIMPAEVVPVASAVGGHPGLRLVGLGTNLACRSGVVPNDTNMLALGAIVAEVELALQVTLPVVSGGNSANLEWVELASDVGRVNDLRLGESILLGRQPLHREAILGLSTEAFTVVAEVIESRTKPSQPWGELGQSAFGVPEPSEDRGLVAQSILAIGRQDVDPDGLSPPAGMQIVGASSDHLVVTTPACLEVGTLVRFQPNYSALVRLMTSPFVTVHHRAPAPTQTGVFGR